MTQEDLIFADWIDLLHYYLLTIVSPENGEKINRALTGPLGDWRRTEPTLAEKMLPRPPPWSNIPLADIERMARAREAQQAEQA